MNVSIVLPSYNPDGKLIEVVKTLVENGFHDIVLVNDGSDEAYLEPFRTLENIKDCTILTHEENKGKGRALKTAFRYLSEHRKGIAGVITVDGDNQHDIKDIIACRDAMISRRNQVILGVRDFTEEGVPSKSKWGNNITKTVFRLLCGLNISDTQTGLRAIPFQYLKDFLQIEGERYEYETKALLELKQRSIPFSEVKIKTIYLEENASSHFNPLRDSIKIYVVILKFLLSSIMSSMIDLGVFSIMVYLLSDAGKSTRLLAATVTARIISSACNFTINRTAVFHAETSIHRTIVKYYFLCILQMLTSYGLVFGVTSLLQVDGGFEIVAKVIIDMILFLISFRIQRNWVFRKS